MHLVNFSRFYSSLGSKSVSEAKDLLNSKTGVNGSVQNSICTS